MPLVVVHPDLGHAQRVALGVEADVVVVGLLLALDVRHPGAGQHLHAAPTQPHLQHRHSSLSTGSEGKERGLRVPRYPGIASPTTRRAPPQVWPLPNTDMLEPCRLEISGFLC